MGRRKIAIQQITDPKLRNITYNKRKNGLIKKAAEISLLCDINLLLVFEDLNGTLVQFSRNKIKSFSNFHKECNFKRVLELTSEDYPNFSRIKRHKKKLDSPEEVICKTPSTNVRNTRTLAQMFSESESIVSKEDIFCSDMDNIRDCETGLNIISESPESFANYSEEEFTIGDISPAPMSGFQPDIVRKAIKTANSMHPSRNNKQKDAKKRANLRLNIPKGEDPVRDAMKSESSGSNKRMISSNSKGNSSQKNYIRKSTYERNLGGKMEMTPSPYQFIGIDSQNQMNMRLVNMLNSPYKDALNQRRLKSFNNFMGEEDSFGNNFTEYSTFNFPIIGTTPPILKQKEDEQFATEKIVNYLSHPGRTPPQQNSIFTFQQGEFQRMTENQMGMDAANNYWDHPMNGKDSCGKADTSFHSGGFSGHKFNFDGYMFGNDERVMDFGEAIRKFKMS